MKLPQPPRKLPEENVLPLINIVFLLLIFFMVAGTLTQRSPFEIDPPRTERGGEPPIPAVRVYLAEDGRLALEGEVISRRALQEEVAALLAAEPGRPVQIKADAEASATELLVVMDRLREAGVERIYLITQGD